MKKVICEISKKSLNPEQCLRGDFLRENILSYIQKDHPDFKPDSYISLEELNNYRRKYLVELVTKEHQEVDDLEKDVLKAITENNILSVNIEPEMDERLTLGQRIADQIAEFGGSWTFIIAFFSFLILWMIVNVWVLVTRPFDPYPFILLNLILSTLAAIQAPIIMMSQNRQEQKDRIRSEHDYKINLKAELEIKLLHEKIDHMIIHQNRRLLDIQEIQADYLEEILKNIKSK
jgi:uncharacterized membrane protein